MSIKQTISTNVPQDSAGVAAVVNEATDGTKAVLTELATKNADDSGFTQVSEGNPLPVQLTGSYVEHRGLSTDTKPTSGNNVGDVFFEIDTTDAYMWNGSSWELI